MDKIRLYTAVEEMVGEKRSTAIIKDGTRICEATVLLGELIDDMTVHDVLVTRGKFVHFMDGRDYVDYSAPKYRVVALSTVTVDDVRNWVAEHIPEAAPVIDEIIDSPLVTTRFTCSGRPYWVWKNGLIPNSLKEVLECILYLLEKWIVDDDTLTDEELLRYQLAATSVGGAVERIDRYGE